MTKDPYPLVRKIITQAVIAAKAEIQKLAISGVFEPFYLYYKQSNDHDAGQLHLFRKSAPPDSSWSLATEDALGIDVPYDNYFTWVHNRVHRLPILPKFE